MLVVCPRIIVCTRLFLSKLLSSDAVLCLSSMDSQTVAAILANHGGSHQRVAAAAAAASGRAAGVDPPCEFADALLSLFGWGSSARPICSGWLQRRRKRARTTQMSLVWRLWVVGVSTPETCAETCYADFAGTRCYRRRWRSMSSGRTSSRTSSCARSRCCHCLPSWNRFGATTGGTSMSISVKLQSDSGMGFVMATRGGRRWER